MDLPSLIKVGETLGYKEGELASWVKEQQELEDKRLEAEKEEKRLEREERQTERELKKLELEAEERKAKLAQDEKEKEREEKEKEREEKEKEREEKVKEREHEKEMRSLPDSANAPPRSQNGIHHVPPPKLPVFDEKLDQFDAYIERFERYMNDNKIQQTEWTMRLSSVLRGPALEVYTRLPVDEAHDYKKLKEALTKKYNLTEEGYRERFMNHRPSKGDTAHQFATQVRNLRDRWLALAVKELNLENLLDVLLRDQILRSCSKDLVTFIKERKVKTADEVTDLIDTYVTAHGGVGLIWGGGQRPQGATGSGMYTGGGGYKSPNVPPKTIKTETNGNGARPNQQSTDRPPVSSLSQHKCFLCKSFGHFARACPKNNGPPKQVASQCLFRLEQKDVDRGEVELVGGRKVYLYSAACKEEHGHLVDKSMPTCHGLINGRHGSVLRDSGCSGVVIRRSLVNDDQMTGEERQVILVDGTVRVVHEAEIEVDTPYYTGKATAVCMAGPVYDLIIGNVDGARDPSNPDPEWPRWVKDSVVKEGCGDDLQVTVGQVRSVNEQLPVVQPAVKSAAAVEMSREAATEVVGESTQRAVVDGTVSSKEVPTLERCSPDEVLKCSAVQTRAQIVKQKQTLKPLKIPTQIGDVTPADLKREQEQDLTLNSIRARLGSKISNQKTEFEIIEKRGLLYKCTTRKNGVSVHQLVVPSKYRDHVLKIAHDSIMAGHLGSRKTMDKIVTQFYWPGMQSDINRYCRSCDVCQKTFPKGKVFNVPLGKMPLIDTPFQRVAIDLVGPFDPMSDRRNRFVLTIVDYATRYPEAVALPNISTETVAEALVDTFCRVGIPSEILSDRGSQFTSEMMGEVSRLLSIRQLRTTPYHPACNGLVERFNGTLKSMIRKMSEERPKDWDRYLGPLLFAYRESPNESLGFSPFEMLMGRTVKGPLAVLKALWTDDVEDPEVKSTYEYVLDLRERLERTCELAQQELGKASARHKRYYDSKARDRTMEVGEKVLILLPTSHNKLTMMWKGPHKIIDKFGSCDYRIDVDGKVKTFHANMLKKYVERDNPPVTCASVMMGEVGDEMEVAPEWVCPPLKRGETISDILVSSHLTNDQSVELNELLSNFDVVLTDVPGLTNLVEYDLKVSTDEPVRTKPYPIPQAVRETITNEVKEMLEHGIIERSDSSYSSPVVLVKKPDGTNRFCVDYRRLNKITSFDSEPMPSADTIFAKLGSDKFFSRLDLSKGYWQIPLSSDTKEKTSFSSPAGSFQFTRLPFGLVCAPAVFTRMMRILLHDIDHVDNYIDDILIHSESWEDHLVAMRKVLERLKEANLTLRPTKCMVGYPSIDFLGHTIGEGKIAPLTATLDKVQGHQRPTTKTQVRSFLGLTGYYREYIPDYAAVAAPLSDLTKNGVPNKVVWGDAQEKAFTALKKALSGSPVLQLPDFDKLFVLRTDASNVGLGAILLQEHGSDIHPVSFASRKLLDREKNYSTVERECLAIVWGIKKFYVFLYGREFVIQTDHQSLIHINQAKHTNSRIMRWAMFLQEYRFRVQDIKGVHNHGADYLSRLPLE